MTARTHLSITVADLDRSEAHYRALLGASPTKRRDDFVRFEVDEPPLVLSLVPGERPGVNHVGARYEDRAAVEVARARLAANGLVAATSGEADCCYARKDEVWMVDPDGVPWELYALVADEAAAGPGAPSPAATPTCCPPTGT